MKRLYYVAAKAGLKTQNTRLEVHKIEWFNRHLLHGSCPFVKIKFKDFSRTFKDHTKDTYGELN